MKKRLVLVLIVLISTSVIQAQPAELKPQQASQKLCLAQLSKNILIGSALGLISGNAWAFCDAYLEEASPSTRYLSTYAMVELPLKGLSQYLGLATNSAYYASYFMCSSLAYFLNMYAGDAPQS